MKKLKLKTLYVNTSSNNIKKHNERVCITEQTNNNTRGISYNHQQQLLTDRYSSRTHLNPVLTQYTSSKSTDRCTVDTLQCMKEKYESGSYVNNVNLKLRLDLNRNVPVYVDKYNLPKAVEKFTISNYNNKYNIYYKKHQYLPSIRSIMRTSKYNVWQSIFIQSLRDKQREEFQLKLKPTQTRHHVKHKSDLQYTNK